MPLVVVWILMSVIGLVAFVSLSHRAWGRWQKAKGLPAKHPVRVIAYSRLRAKIAWSVTVGACLAVGVAVQWRDRLPFELPPGVSIGVIFLLLFTAVTICGVYDELDDRRMM